MPEIFTNTADALAEAAVPTTGNTGAGSGTPAAQVEIDANSTVTALAAAAVHGTRGYRFNLSATGSGATRIRWPLAGTGRVVIAAHLRVHTAITAAEDLLAIRHAGGHMALLGTRGDGRFVASNAAGAQQVASISPDPVAAGLYLIQLAARKGTSTTDGHIGIEIRDGDTGTLIHTWEASDVNAGTANPTQGYIGRSTGRAITHTLDYDTITGSDDPGWIPPVSLAPTADAGPDQSGMEPYSTVTLSSASSSTVIGTITGHAWTQISGPPIILTGADTATPSFAAPCTMDGQPVTLQVTVTNSGGHSDTDTVTVTPLPAVMAVRRGGAWAPLNET